MRFSESHVGCFSQNVGRAMGHPFAKATVITTSAPAEPDDPRYESCPTSIAPASIEHRKSATGIVPLLPLCTSRIRCRWRVETWQTTSISKAGRPLSPAVHKGSARPSHSGLWRQARGLRSGTATRRWPKRPRARSVTTPSWWPAMSPKQPTLPRLAMPRSKRWAGSTSSSTTRVSRAPMPRPGKPTWRNGAR